MDTYYFGDNGRTTSSTTMVVYRRITYTGITTARMDMPTLKLTPPNALPRGSQLEQLERLSSEGRRLMSASEGARHGWQDAPRRPCYRAPRIR